MTATMIEPEKDAEVVRHGTCLDTECGHRPLSLLLPGMEKQLVCRSGDARSLQLRHVKAGLPSTGSRPRS